MKLQASDLRIGNYLIGANGEVHQIDRYGLADLCLEDGLIDNQKPIPLTEEWLVKMGFEKLGYNEYSIELPINIYYVTMSENNLWTAYIQGYGQATHNYGVSLLPISDTFIYVHQLQNLYHALTGQELTFNK